jgi:hypothetical protein
MFANALPVPLQIAQSPPRARKRYAAINVQEGLDFVQKEWRNIQKTQHALPIL